MKKRTNRGEDGKKYMVVSLDVGLYLAYDNERRLFGNYWWFNVVLLQRVYKKVTQKFVTLYVFIFLYLVFMDYIIC